MEENASFRDTRGMSNPSVNNLPAGSRVLRPDPLFAWCIVPYDGKKRSPLERAAMLTRLGFRSYVYDWRNEHVALFGEEAEVMGRHGVEFLGWWISTPFDIGAERCLAAIDRFGLKPQLWVSFFQKIDTTGLTEDEAEAKQLAAHIDLLAPYVEAATKRGLKVGLYNHGGWFGEPENQLRLIGHYRSLGHDNLGIAYNLHHGHDHMARFGRLWEQIRPHLLALNLNGMVEGGDKDGRKILPLGQGDRELELLRIVADSGWRGPIGLLNHTQEDAEARLLDNLDGLAWVQNALAGNPPGPRPAPRSWKPL